MGTMPNGLRPSPPPVGGSTPPPRLGGGMVNGPASNNVGWGTVTTGAGTLMASKSLVPGASMPSNPAAAAYIQDFDRWLDKSPSFNMPLNRQYVARDTTGNVQQFTGSDLMTAKINENGKVNIGLLEVDATTYLNLSKQLDASERGFEREIENHRLAGRMHGFC